MKNKQLLDDLNYASFNRRILAGTIDIIVLAIILTPVSHLLDFFLYDGQGLLVMIGDFFKNRDNTVDSEELWQFLSDNHIIAKYFFVQITLFAIIGFFFIGFWLYRGQTPGKVITSCKIVDAKSGNVPTKRQYIIRFFSYIPSTLLLCLGFIIVSFTKKKQGLHDIIADTVVIVDKNYSKYSKFHLS